MPVPAPGTLELLRGVPRTSKPTSGKELVTPTGAAIITNPRAEILDLCQQWSSIESGYGAGTRDLEEQPNLLRIITGEKKSDFERGPGLSHRKQNLDDLSPEITAYVTEKLFEQGALDVFLTPILMKKGRPATKTERAIKTSTIQGAMMENPLHGKQTTFGVRCFHC